MRSNKRNSGNLPQGVPPQWIVTRSEGNNIQDQETFRHFGDAWAYAQPDPENGIYHYIHKATVLQHFHQTPTTPLTTAYEGNIRIRISLRGGRPPHPPTVSQFTT